MSFRKAPWRLIAGLAAALIATPTLAIEPAKLQSIRSSLSVEEIVAFAVSKSTAPTLDIDKTIEMNIVLNVKGMERSDVQSLQIELLRVFSAIGAYAEIGINFDASRSIDYSPATPYAPFDDQNQPPNTQTLNVFIDRDALKLAKSGQIAVHDIDTLRSKPDTSTCYHESRIGNPAINVIVDRDINPMAAFMEFCCNQSDLPMLLAEPPRLSIPEGFPASGSTLKWRQHMPFANADLSSIKKISLRNA